MNNQRPLAKWLATKSPDTRVWSDYLAQLPIKTGEGLNALMLYSQDLGCYEAVRRLLCSNCITHGDPNTHLGDELDLTNINTWKTIKQSYGKVDYVISVSAPGIVVEYILAYGWALSRHGVILAAPSYWLEHSKVATYLEPPIKHTIEVGSKQYWSWHTVYYWEKN